MDVATYCGGTTCITCQFCNRVHFVASAEGIEALRQKAEKQPDKYLESADDSLAFGILDGHQYVWGCPCDSGDRYESFIWEHRLLIAEYLKRRAALGLKEAQANSALMESLLGI